MAVRAVHLVVLSSFAIAQPLFAVFRASPDFFVSRRSQPVDLIVFAAVLVLGLPVVALAVSEAVGRIRPTWREYTHLAFVALLFGLLFLTVLSKARSLELADTLVLASVGSAIATVLYARRWASQLLSIGAPAPLLFVFLFLFTPPVSQLGFGGRAAPQAVASAPATAPVVFVVFDEFPLPSLMTPAGSLDARRFPNIAALTQSSTWYRHAGSVDSLTKWAVPAILSGRLGDLTAIPSDASYPDNLFTLLSGSGYKMRVTEPITSLCTQSVCTERKTPPTRQRLTSLLATTRQVYARMLFPGHYSDGPASITDPFGEFLGEVGESSGAARDAAAGAAGTPGTGAATPNPNPTQSFESTAETLMHSDRAGRFRSFVSEIDGADKQLHFIHILLPHTPYEYPGSDGPYDVAPTSDEFKQAIAADGGNWVSEASYQRELLQMRFVDQLVGQLTDHLKQVGVFDRSLIVMTADHGVNWQPFQAPREAGETSRYEVGMVPLIIKAPFQRAGEVNDALVQTTDILPTVAGMLHLSVPWQTDGHDVRDPANPPRTDLRIRDHLHADPVVLDDPAGGGLQAASRVAQMFGEAGSPYDVFDVVGPYAGMLGRRVSELPRPADAGVVASFTDPALNASGPTTLPTLQLGGIVRGPVEPGSWVAVVVNGAVAAVVPAVTPAPAPPAPAPDPLAPIIDLQDPGAVGSSGPDPLAPDSPQPDAQPSDAAQPPDATASAPAPAPTASAPAPPPAPGAAAPPAAGAPTTSPGPTGAPPAAGPALAAPPAALPRLQAPLPTQAAFLALLAPSLAPRSGPVTVQLFLLSGVGPGLRLTTITVRPTA